MKIDRRKFLQTSARSLAVAGLVGGGGYLAARKGGAGCTEKGICHTCGVNGDCGLPQAQMYRRHIARKNQKGDRHEQS